MTTQEATLKTLFDPRETKKGYRTSHLGTDAWPIYEVPAMSKALKQHKEPCAVSREKKINIQIDKLAGPPAYLARATGSFPLALRARTEANVS